MSVTKTIHYNGLSHLLNFFMIVHVTLVQNLLQQHLNCFGRPKIRNLRGGGYLVRI